MKVENVKAEANNTKQIGAPLQGLLSKIFVKKGQTVKKNQPLFIIEAKKTETTINALAAAKVKHVALKEAWMVNAEDLVIPLV